MSLSNKYMENKQNICTQDKYRENTWKNIHETWTEKEYKKASEEWLKTVKNITHYGSYRCDKCYMKWKDKSFIIRDKNICGSCDDWYKPNPSNPKNKIFVLKYINDIYYKYIFYDSEWKNGFDRAMREFKKKRKIF